MKAKLRLLEIPASFITASVPERVLQYWEDNDFGGQWVDVPVVAGGPDDKPRKYTPAEGVEK